MTLIRPPAGQIGVLIVDADPSQRRTLARMIAETGDRFATRACSSHEEAVAAMRDNDDAVVIADIDTIGGTERLFAIAATRPLIATSANASLSNAVAAIKGGAVDFLPKPIGARGLKERLDTAVASWNKATLRPEAPVAKGHAGGDFIGFIGRSPAMTAVYEQIRRVAPSRAPVFITGESGTGKELCAEAVHACADPSGARPFVAINCSAIPKDLMESEIFGHVRGAFTGASDARAGAAELADGGTLFLDEIGEMDLALQAKLLRFVQTGTIRRVGGSKLDPVDVRIVCATNRDPLAEVQSGRFRADLFYRLHVLPIDLPPLRQRGNDIRLLARSLLARFSAEEGRAFAGFDPEAEALVAACPWPGNVRQLANVIRRVVVLNDGHTVTPAMLPELLSAGGPTAIGAALDLAPSPSMAPVSPFRDQERQIIETALAAFDGNIARAAAALEISPATIYRKRQTWGPTALSA